MDKLFNWVQKYSTGKIVSSLFVLTLIVYLFMIGYSIPAVSAFTLLKSGFSTVFFVSVLVGFALLMKKRLSSRLQS